MEVVESLQRATGLPKAASPALGGLIVGLLALMYPEVLYWGFVNVEILLESRPFTSGLSTTIRPLMYPEVLYWGFIGAATGMAYVARQRADWNLALERFLVDIEHKESGYRGDTGTWSSEGWNQMLPWCGRFDHKPLFSSEGALGKCQRLCQEQRNLPCHRCQVSKHRRLILSLESLNVLL